MKYLPGALYSIAFIGFFVALLFALKPLTDPKAKNLALVTEVNRNIAARKQAERKAMGHPWNKRKPAQLAAPILR